MDPRPGRPSGGGGGAGACINAAGWSLLLLSGAVVGARVWAKASARRGLWWDDYIVLAAWVMLLADVIVTTAAVAAGLGGPHAADGGAAGGAPARAVLLAAVAQALSGLAAAWSKTSLAVALLRMGPQPAPHVRCPAWLAVASLNILLALAAAVPLASHCTPAAAAGAGPGAGGAWCWDPSAVLSLAVSGAACSAAADFVLSIIPAVVTRKSKMDLKDKIGVGVCMSLGFLAAASAIMRCLRTSLAPEGGGLTPGAGQLAIWSAAEVAATIAAASVPALRPWPGAMAGGGGAGGPGASSWYLASSADGMFDGRGVQHNSAIMTTTTTITSGGNVVRKASSRRGRPGAAAAGFGSRGAHDMPVAGGAAGGIVKMETITVDYGRRTASMVG